MPDDTTTATVTDARTHSAGAAAPRHRFRSFFLGSLCLAVLLLGLYTMFMLWYSYAEGERAGVLQKFSKRGWICKTYEGELAMYVVGGVAPQIWHFSVRDPEVADQFHKAVGQQMRIHYTEHRGLPTNCFGETDYFGDRFEAIAPPPGVQSSSGLNVTPATPGTAPAVNAPPAGSDR